MQTIEIGDIVRSYDFPGTREDCYVEGVVINDPRAGYYMIHVTRDVHVGQDEQVGARLTVRAPLGVSSMTGAAAVVLLAKAKVPA